MNFIKKIKGRFKKHKNENIKKQFGWFDSYKSWESASKECTGYDSDIILNTVKESLLKIKNGEAVYERDSVLFDKKQYSEELLKGLLTAAAENDYHLNVIDFGGSLGSTYFQNKTLLAHLKSVHWNVVEQKNFVKEGKKTFEDDTLKFYSSIKECINVDDKQILLVSNTIQYLSNPYKFIEEILSYEFKYILFESTSFIKDEQEMLTIQVVPETIYKAKYPMWFLNESNFLSKFSSKYSLKTEFNSFHTPSNIVNGKKVYWKGFLFIKK